MRTRILVAGLAGASLGTEIIKCLTSAGEYDIYGCDISPLAYGLHSPELTKSLVADTHDYINSIIKICLENDIKFIIPGGEQPMVLLAAASGELCRHDLILVGNSPEIISLFSNKETTFNFLKDIGIDVPFTKRVHYAEDLSGVEFPCIVKPSSGTGGSDSVFLAANKEECVLFVELLIKNNKDVIIQEYIDVEEGEFTIGVLSDTTGKVLGSVAMQRIFNSKLSLAYKGTKGLISSGYSQGLISDFKDIRELAEHIAKKSGSRGPFNIQGRIKKGKFIPFEVNPRFSASTHLRNLAGFNEIHFYLRHLINNETHFDWTLKEGYYLRSFNELFVPKNAIENYD